MNSFHPTWEDVHLCSEMHGHRLVMHNNPVTKQGTAVYVAAEQRIGTETAGVYSQHRVAPLLMKITILCKFLG